MVFVLNVKRNNMNTKILSLYEEEMPSFLLPFLQAKELTRISKVGMHCGMEFTSFPFYCHLKPYSRYEHSLGVALIVFYFTHDKKMTLAGLFHDIATPCFAHVIDFLKGDHETQESTEEKTSSIISSSITIQKELEKLNLMTSDVDDYHRYPIADNNSPKLSADRLEYTLHNFLNFHLCTYEEVEEMYRHLTVIKNEDNIDELAFIDERIAEKFALLTLKNSYVYVADEDRYGMEYLARILKREIYLHRIEENDLYGIEEDLISKLNRNPESKKEWESFTHLSSVTKESTPSSPYSYKIPSKKRYIDPLVVKKGRISSLSSSFKKELETFLNWQFDYYLKP